MANTADRVRRKLSRLVARPDAPAMHPICESVLQWALDHPGTHVERLAPAMPLHISPPHTFEPAINDIFAAPWNDYTVPEKYLARINGARLVRPPGLLVLPDGAVASESAYNSAMLETLRGYQRPARSERVRQRGSFYSLVIVHGLKSNYYHWLHDVVLRLYGILEHLPDDVRFIVPPRLQPFQYDALALVGIGPDRLIEYDGHTEWRLDELYFSPPTTASSFHSPAADAWLRDLALTTHGIALGPARRRIYISRRQAARRLVNESEVESVLADRGFETHQLEDYDLREKVALLAEAEAIVGPHGAGHANMLFAPPGLKVIDIFEPTRLSRSYWTMSDALGHEYWYVFGETVAVADADSDIRMPVGKLTKVLDAAGVT